MKKLFTSLLLLLIAYITHISAQTCNPAPVPFSESFSSGAVPTCWVNQNPNSSSTSANVKWKFAGSADYGATGNGGKPAGTFAWVDASTPYDNINTVELLTPQINLTGLTVPYVKFEWFKNHLTSLTGTLPNYDNNKLKVEVNSGSGWVQIFSDDTNSSEWRSVGIPLAASYIGATVQLKFTVNKDASGNGYFYDDVLLDEVQVVEAPTCFVPSGLVSNVTPNTATLSWTAPTQAPANGYEYYINTTNTAPTSGTLGTPVTGISVPVTVSSANTYYWWVRSVCSSTDKSAWAPGAAFTSGQIGSGTGTGRLPVYSYFGYNYSQQIYTASEVLGAVGASHYITSIKFYVATPQTPLANYDQWVIYMGHTNQNNFANNTSWIPIGSLSQVFSGTLSSAPANTWVEIPLSSPFLWNGTDNIVIAVDENSPGYTGSPGTTWGTYNAGSNKGILYYNDSTNPSPASPPTASERYSDIPRVQLVGVDLQPCTTAAPANITVSNVTPSTAFLSWTPSVGASYTLQYRTLPSGTWVPVNITGSLVNSYTLQGLAEQTQYEVQISTICGGASGPFSSSVNFTTPAISYCTSAPTTTFNYEYISNVTVTPTGFSPMVSNSTPPPPYYSDYTADTSRIITLIKGTSNNQISVTKVWPGIVYDSGTRAWIDFNRNGTFEASEMILDSPSNGTSVVGNNNFTVPANAYSGNLPVRMRVILRESGSPDPCGSFTYGEVEDYSVRLIDLQPCTTAAPTNVTATNLTASTAYISWMPTSGAVYRIRWRKQNTTAWLPQPQGYLQLASGATSYTITGLEEQAAYEVQLLTECNGTLGSFGTSTIFTTPPISYCNMTGTGTNDHISNVKVNSANPGVNPMSNTSVQNNYTSYATPATLITLDIGSTGNQISVSKGWTGSTYSDAVSAWIDFNRNGTFEASEQILASPTSTATPVTNLFDVPSTAYNGVRTTTMRVVLKRNSAPTMCEASTANGEVEDYAVKLRPCNTTVPGAPTVSGITHNAASITWTSPGDTTYFVRYRKQGPPAGAWVETYTSTQLGNIPLALTGLDPATIYEVQIATVCGATVGTFSPLTVFTTKCDPTPPNVTITGVTSTSAVVTWSPLAVSANYVLRYRIVGSGAAGWNNPLISLPAAPTNTYTLQNLTPYTSYEVQIANKCNGSDTINPWSNPKIFITERTCELPPPGLTITNLTPTTAEIEWDAFPGATYILSYRKVGIPSWTNVPTAVNTVTLTGLTELTKYEMQVVNVCSGTPGNYTPPYFFTTPTVRYCQMASGSSAGEFISKVTVKPNGKPVMENTSGASTYTDYTGVNSKFIQLIQGSTGNEITIEKSWVGSQNNEGIAVWIDFDRSGTFDYNERILVSSPNTNTPITGTFNVPADAFVSLTDYKYVVMRVAMQRDGIPVNCTNFQNGEVEDYTVRISKQVVPNPTNQTDILIYPNPVKSTLNVKNVSKRVNYKIYNATGQVISSGIILNNSIDVKQLINGVYVIDIEDNGVSVQRKFIKE
ncbi:GEVED domain-containing protein [Chryseobacterium potabilaquae]|uniref:Fibronectin type-III domain-containing protein n=1 Tax=Chryseobacterium potabilaquae TaxID=2675057 RepID=A0A6N4X374_9FLAO|nr:fibronectin type III domain-containing protein [Chryseobacterium potabilaquae]CAA7194861.1 hypothetical protein CHRY9293_01140 [Chryseobacterium potabilaquae]